jgi:hypothetical protein
MIKQITSRSTPAEINRATRRCIDGCGCTRTRSAGNDDDIIIVEESDLAAVLTEQRMTTDTIVVDSDDLDAALSEVLDQLRRR